ncbi:MAG: hypothetical protein ABIW46_02590 [Acidimicrobiales bacterium]
MADPRSMLKEAAYTTVGFAVIGFQRAQVQRREFERWLRQMRDDPARGRGSQPK